MPAGVRIDPIRPADAHRVTVFGSTLKIRATSPGVSNRSGVCMATTCLQSGPNNSTSGHPQVICAVPRLIGVRCRRNRPDRMTHTDHRECDTDEAKPGLPVRRPAQAQRPKCEKPVRQTVFAAARHGPGFCLIDTLDGRFPAAGIALNGYPVCVKWLPQLVVPGRALVLFSVRIGLTRTTARWWIASSDSTTPPTQGP